MQCETRYIKDIAIVQIYFNSPLMTVMKQDVRKSFYDKLCDVGKFKSNDCLIDKNMLKHHKCTILVIVISRQIHIFTCVTNIF